jgi:hypothetical protein
VILGFQRRFSKRRFRVNAHSVTISQRLTTAGTGREGSGTQVSRCERQGYFVRSRFQTTLNPVRSWTIAGDADAEIKQHPSVYRIEQTSIFVHFILSFLE